MMKTGEFKPQSLPTPTGAKFESRQLHELKQNRAVHF